MERLSPLVDVRNRLTSNSNNVSVLFWLGHQLHFKKMVCMLSEILPWPSSPTALLSFVSKEKFQKKSEKKKGKGSVASSREMGNYKKMNRRRKHRQLTLVLVLNSAKTWTKRSFTFQFHRGARSTEKKVDSYTKKKATSIQIEFDHRIRDGPPLSVKDGHS